MPSPAGGNALNKTVTPAPASLTDSLRSEFSILLCY